MGWNNQAPNLAVGSHRHTGEGEPRRLPEIPSPRNPSYAWPRTGKNGNVAKERRSLARCKLKECKATDKVPQTFGITWPYFSGFFDAEGHVKVRPNANCLELELWQKQPLILLTLLHFLEDKGFDSWRIHTRRNEHFLYTVFHDRSEQADLAPASGKRAEFQR